jgi:hypothetical protein
MVPHFAIQANAGANDMDVVMVSVAMASHQARMAGPETHSRQKILGYFLPKLRLDNLAFRQRKGAVPGRFFYVWPQPRANGEQLHEALMALVWIASRRT